MNESLVGGFNPSEKYESVGSTIPNIWKPTLASLHSLPAGLNLQTRGTRATKKYIRNPWENGASSSEYLALAST